MFDEDTMPEWMKAMRNADMGIDMDMGMAQPQQCLQPQELNQLPGPPPGFVRIPEGMSPALGPQQGEPVQIPVPGAGPHGLPFGIPPGNYF